MKIKSIFAAAAITLIAGVGSVSADEITVADAKDTPPKSFDLLHDIAAARMTVKDLATTRGAQYKRPPAVVLIWGSTLSFGR